MKLPPAFNARWERLAAREKALVLGAGVLVGAAALWWIAIAPALATLRDAAQQHSALDAQLQEMRGWQMVAQAMQSQPRLGYDDAARALEASMRQRLGATARLTIVGERANITLAGVAPDALAQWLAQARINARALPAEARLTRSAAGLWDGTLVLVLPAR